MQDAFVRSRNQADGRTWVPPEGNPAKVFSAEQEKNIVDYAVKIAKMLYGLTIKEVCQLAYKYAVACESKSIPSSWVQIESANRDWYYGFMSRHPALVVKAPEGISIA